MKINRLDHFSIRTTKLDETVRFFSEVLGLTPGARPPFPFPGAWMYDSERPIVHILGVDPDNPTGLIEYMGNKDVSHLAGSGAVDHAAFACTDLDGLYARLVRHPVPFRERTVPGMNLHQVFLEDPNGITMELNFSAEERARSKAPRPACATA